jgi:nucleotide-binding universal stress UspA family protein
MVFQHILVPFDFGEVADHALDVAVRLAAPLEAKITVFHASWLPASAPVSFGEGFEWPTDEFEKHARETLARVVAKAKARYARIDGLVVKGEPREEILANAARLGVDLIVMGTHGRRGMARALLGSVAERIVRTSPVPVLTVSLAAERTTS